ncbi:hypothetical protein GCM10007863_24940 [Dyella mobilis]|nr:hypothetical protein GCM10007863_24940 [Dyella mobilis]
MGEPGRNVHRFAPTILGAADRIEIDAAIDVAPSGTQRPCQSCNCAAAAFTRATSALTALAMRVP